MPVSPAYRPDIRHPALGDAFYDPVQTAAFPNHVLRFRNDRWAERIGLESLTDEEWVRHFGRFEPLPDNLGEPLALRYHGHQFRTYNPELGDGRGFLFAQLRDRKDGRLLDLGTKGSGQTPWSRQGDGRLTLKGGVREILATEMLEALGTNTSKTFSLIETGEALYRGDEPSPTRSSVLVRLSHGHIRFGTFQRLMVMGQAAEKRALVDYVIETYWPGRGRRVGSRHRTLHVDHAGLGAERSAMVCRRVCPWRPEHGQHGHNRGKFRLRSMAFPADLGSGLHRRLFRQYRPLQFRTAAGSTALEPRPSCGMSARPRPAAAVRRGDRSIRRIVRGRTGPANALGVWAWEPKTSDTARDLTRTFYAALRESGRAL